MLRLDPAAIAKIASTVTGSVCVEELPPIAGIWNRKPIAISRNGREVAHD
jgi:hypothetical protein